MPDHDQKLVEAVAPTMLEILKRIDTVLGGALGEEYDLPQLAEDFLPVILAAIDASGIAWVAPYDPPPEFTPSGLRVVVSSNRMWFANMRDACLAERRGAGAALEERRPAE